jgi:hypothetical protein
MFLVCAVGHISIVRVTGVDRKCPERIVYVGEPIRAHTKKHVTSRCLPTTGTNESNRTNAMDTVIIKELLVI